MTSYAAIAGIAEAHVRAAIAAGATADTPPGVTAAAREDGIMLTGPRLGERWHTDPHLRAIGDAVRAAAR